MQRVFRAKRTNLHEKYDYPQIVPWPELAGQTWMVSPVGVPGRESFDALAAVFPHPPHTYPVISRSIAMIRWVLRRENVLAYLPYTFVRPLIEAGEMAEVAVKPQVDIEPLGLLRPITGLSEATERLAAFLQVQFPPVAPSKRPSTRLRNAGSKVR